MQGFMMIFGAVWKERISFLLKTQSIDENVILFFDHLVRGYSYLLLVWSNLLQASY